MVYALTSVYVCELKGVYWIDSCSFQGFEIGYSDLR